MLLYISECDFFFLIIPTVSSQCVTIYLTTVSVSWNCDYISQNMTLHLTIVILFLVIATILFISECGLVSCNYNYISYNMTLYLANVSVSRNCNYNTYLRDLLYILQLTLFLITASTYLRMLQYLIIAIVNWTCNIYLRILLCILKL